MSERVARWLDLDDRRTRRERASTQLRPGQVHEYAAFPTGRLFGATEMLEHASPCRFVIMRAVDAHTVHAVLEQVLDQAVVIGGFAGHCDHDRHAAISGPKQGFSMNMQQSLPCFEIDMILVGLVRVPTASDRLVENRKHGVNRRQDVRFCAPEGREACRRQPYLQRPPVVAAEPDVMQQVHRALALSHVDLIERV